MPARNMNSAMIHWAPGEKACDRVRLCREAAGRHRREGVRERLVRRHRVVDAEPAERREQQRQHDRQPDVEDPEHAGGLADALAESRDLRSGELGLHHLPSTDAEPRQHGDGEDDDPHAAEPLRELAPHRERAREVVEVGDDARAGRRRRGHALEVGVDRVVELLAADEEVRERRERRRHEQHRRDDEEALAHADLVTRACREPLEPEPERARAEAGHDERPHRIAVPERDADREDDDEAEVLRERPDEVRDGADVDREAPRAARFARRPESLERLDDPGSVRCLGEDDHAVTRLEDVVAVREDRVAVAHDRADQRAVHGHVAKRHADVAARRPAS